MRASFNLDENVRKQSIKDESPLLLDPTKDDPAQYISFIFREELEHSIVVPWPEGGEPNERGLATIMIYGLNRLKLVQARTALKRKLDFLLYLTLQLKNMSIIVGDRKKVLEQELSQSPSIKEDIIFFTNINATLERLDVNIWDSIEQLMLPDEPYSEFVKAWRRDKIKKLELELSG